MIKEIPVTSLSSLRQSPIDIDNWTSTPPPDIRIYQWQLYREAEVNRILETIDQDRNVVIRGCEQAGKSTLMVEAYFALLGADIPVFGFSTRAILAELPFPGGENFNQICDHLSHLSEETTVFIDNVDYLYSEYSAMERHEYVGGHYKNPEGVVEFKSKMNKLIGLLTGKNYKLVFSVHNDWQKGWIDPELFSAWDNLLGKNIEIIELNPCLAPEKAAIFLKLERGISIKGSDQNHLYGIIGKIPFTDLKRKAVQELQEVFNSSPALISQTLFEDST